ncbi:MAG: DUF6778 family protein [Planktotalea sp.]|uniref:DUF6778 family protein n=1 Tax=Planktotalea sp. TaxID=2029877 RepID=UPI003C77ECD4
MKKLRILLAAIAAVSVSACAGPQMASRNATATSETAQNLQATSVQKQNAVESIAVFVPDVSIAKITVDVPKTLVVSEKNSYFPKGDIVWRGDLFGDRHEQVKSILMDSAKRTASKLTGSRPVHMHIQVTRFHGLSEKARYSTGGVHNMNFFVTLLDPVTGATLRPAREVVTNLDAFGGTAAIAADARGETQKARVTTFLEQVLRTELTQPAGFQDQNTGFFVTLNKN